MEKLVSAYLDGDIPKDIYLNQKDVIMRSTLTLKDKMKAFEQRRNTWVEPLREWVLDLQQATFLHESDNLSEIAAFVKKIGTNHTVRDKTAHFATPSPFQFVAQRQAFLPSAAALQRQSPRLNSDEVKFCALTRNVFHYMDGTDVVSSFASLGRYTPSLRLLGES